MDPMTVLIRATDPTTLATTLEGIITAKNETPHRVVVFAVNPPPALTATGRLDFHFDVAKEKFTPVALTAMWMQAVRHCGDEKIVMMRDVVYPGPYWLDMLNQTGRVNLLSRVIFTPPDLAVANTIYRPEVRAALQAELARTLGDLSNNTHKGKEDHYRQDIGALAPFLISKKALEENAWKVTTKPDTCATSLVASLYTEKHAMKNEAVPLDVMEEVK